RIGGTEGSRRPATRRAARTARRAHRRAAFAESASRLGRQSRAGRPRAAVAERVASGARLRRARAAGPAGAPPPRRMTNRATAALVTVAVAAGAIVAGVGLATRGSGKPARVVEIDEVHGRVGRVALDE